MEDQKVTAFTTVGFSYYILAVVGLSRLSIPTPGFNPTTPNFVKLS
jgi:hypothetical protein